MNIIIANHWLRKLGGSETWTYAMAMELKRQGHNVAFFTYEQGQVSARLREENILPCTVNFNPDLILANHYTTVDFLRSQFPDVKIVQTIHGTTPKLEKPSIHASEYVAISNEIRDFLSSKHKITSRVILNGIDCIRFNSKRPINKKIKRVLSLSHSYELNDRLRKIFDLRKIKLETLNKYKNPVWHVEDYINNSDLIVSIGRGIYEAMACGRPVVVLDKRSYQPLMGDGFLSPTDLAGSLTCNCSGRFLKRTDVTKMISEAIDNYSLYNPAYNRIFAVKNLNVEIQAQEYLKGSIGH